MHASVFHAQPPLASRLMNTLVLAGLCGVMGMALAWQLIYDELPCPLCLLQRVGFLLAGIGVILNLRFGPSPLHYGMIILSALGGAAVSGRQVLLHIAPGDPGYGSLFLGLHFYTWALILFIALIAYAGVMLLLERPASGPLPALRPRALVAVLMWLFLVLAAANLLSTVLECGLGPCADDPVRYELLSLTS